MGMFFDDRMMPTNMVVVGLLVVLLILTLMSTIFAGKAMEGLASGVGATTVTVAPGFDQRFGSQASHTGAYGSFLGGPEPPVFYDIGDIEMVRADRANVKPEGLDPGRWKSTANLRDSFDDANLLAK